MSKRLGLGESTLEQWQKFKGCNERKVSTQQIQPKAKCGFEKPGFKSCELHLLNQLSQLPFPWFYMKI